MERVVKRFLLHNNRETEDIRESDFDELKQDVQMVRFESLNSLRQNKEDAVRYTSILHNGLSILGEFVCQSMQNSDILANLRDFQQYEKKLDEEFDDYSDSSKQTNSQFNSKGVSLNKEEVESIKSQMESKSARKRSSNLSIKNDEEGASLDNVTFKESDENKINADAKERLAKQGFLDLNAINEEN